MDERKGMPISKYIRTEIGAAVPRHCKGMISYAASEVEGMEAELLALRKKMAEMEGAGNAMRSFILDLQQRGTWGVTSLYENRSDKLMSAWTASLNPKEQA